MAQAGYTEGYRHKSLQKQRDTLGSTAIKKKKQTQTPTS